MRISDWSSDVCSSDLFGDPVTQKPTPFRVSATLTAGDDEEEVPFDSVSVFERLAELLPVATLTRSYRAGGEDLAELVNDAFYGGEVVSLPWAGASLCRGCQIGRASVREGGCQDVY